VHASAHRQFVAPPRPPSPPPVPYTTLFRSRARCGVEPAGAEVERAAAVGQVLSVLGTGGAPGCELGGGPGGDGAPGDGDGGLGGDRKSTRLNSSHVKISYAVFCLKKKTTTT